jgi:hypothetical protein
MPLICGSHMGGCNDKRIRCLPSWQWIIENACKMSLWSTSLDNVIAHTFMEKCLDEPAARSTITATKADGLVNSHDGDKGVKKWSNLAQRGVILCWFDQ